MYKGNNSYAGYGNEACAIKNSNMKTNIKCCFSCDYFGIVCYNFGSSNPCL